MFSPSRYKTTFPLISFIFWIFFLSASVPYAQQEPLKFGMSTALTGPAANLGINMRHGVLLAFQESNQQGGIQGRKLELIAMDDGYEPSRTAPNMMTLIQEENVLAIVGNVGTPTAVVSLPIISEHKVLFYGAFTGAMQLRNIPADRYVVNFRANYEEETQTIVNALIEQAGLKVEEFAFFTQRDAYGDSGYKGGMAALKNHGLVDPAIIAHGRYERNTTTIEGALADILEAKHSVKAIIMVGAYKPSAKFIRMAKENGLKDAYFMNLSFVGTESLITELNGEGENVFIMQVVPPLSSQLPIVEEYLQAVADLTPDIKPTLGSLEGYISTKILIGAMRNIKSDINRESIINALESLGDFEFGLDGKLNLSQTNHQASHMVWPTAIENSQAVLYEWKHLKK